VGWQETERMGIEGMVGDGNVTGAGARSEGFVGREEIIALLREWTDELLDTDVGSSLDETSVLAELGFDSLAQLELLTRLESEFRVNVPDDRLPRTQSVGGLVELILELVAENRDVE
jgi:acyl carrier protein